MKGIFNFLQLDDRLGPAKGKDFASSLGPLIVTREALVDRAAGRAGVYDLEMRARVNGVEMSKGNLKDIFWSFGEIIARASQSVTLQPGDVIGSGTVGMGCLLELTKGNGPWLQPGEPPTIVFCPMIRSVDGKTKDTLNNSAAVRDGAPAEGPRKPRTFRVPRPPDCGDRFRSGRRESCPWGSPAHPRGRRGLDRR